MAKRFNLTLTDELAAFVESNCGDSTDFNNNNDYIKHLIRQAKRQAIEKMPERLAIEATLLNSLEECLDGQGVTPEQARKSLNNFHV